jgi:hypothetical protein
MGVDSVSVSLEGFCRMQPPKQQQVVSVRATPVDVDALMEEIFFFSPEALQSGRGRRPPTKTRQAGAPNAGQKKDKDENAQHRCQGRSLEF